MAQEAYCWGSFFRAGHHVRRDGTSDGLKKLKNQKGFRMERRFLFMSMRSWVLLGVFIMLSGCASKSFVRGQTLPLSNRLAKVENRLDRLNKKVAGLKSALSMQDAAINELKKDVAKVKNMLKSAVSRQDAAINELKKDMAKAKSKLKSAVSRASLEESRAKRAETAAARAEKAYRRCERAFRSG